MCSLNGMIMRLKQDPDEYLTEVSQQRGDLEYIGESCTGCASWVSSWRV